MSRARCIEHLGHALALRFLPAFLVRVCLSEIGFFNLEPLTSCYSNSLN